MILKMKYRFEFLIFLFLISCTTTKKLDNKIPFNSSGFAYIYNEQDYKNKIIKNKFDNSKLQISHSVLKLNSYIKIINPKTKESIVLKNIKKINYSDFYKILITKEVANKLNLNSEFPLVEILEIKKNKSFVAKKAKIFNEEKKLPSNAPVASVEISNISKNKKLKKNKNKEKFFILVGSFYEKEVAEYLKERISKEISNYDKNKLIIIKKSNKETNLLSGPYYTINLMKNDYILLKNLGFEELDIIYK